MSSNTPNDRTAPDASGRHSEIVVCLKWVPLRPDIDLLSGPPSDDQRFGGSSAADLAALETALRLAKHGAQPVTVVTVGGSVADPMLRRALAAGAKRAVRLDPGPPGPDSAGPDSSEVARLLAGLCASASFVVCGSYSLDRGSGSVPAFLAGQLGAAQALGLVSVEQDELETDGSLMATRRLDHGRREQLSITSPAVISVEPFVELRRASLPSVLQAAEATVEVRSVSAGADQLPLGQVHPFRPRAKVVAPPIGKSGDRVAALAGLNEEQTPPQLLQLSPAEAAVVAARHLRRWGYTQP